ADKEPDGEGTMTTVHVHLPEDDVQDDKNHKYNRRPEDGPLIERKMPFRREFRRAVDEAHEFVFRLRRSHTTYYHRNNDTDDPRPGRPVHVLRHILGVRRQRDVTQRGVIELHPKEHT